MPGLNPQKLKIRTISALILIAGTLSALYLGGWAFNILLGIGSVIALYEWLQLARKTPHKITLSIGGAIYIIAALTAFYIIRSDSFQSAFIFFTVVWVSDIGAYFCGKFIGGAKMLPAISPNKTWAGLAGALISPAILLSGYFLLAFPPSGQLFSWAGLLLDGILLGAIFGLFSQIGDLMVSSLKRLAGEKDSGHLIPGHGGLLDRIDSLMLVAIFMLVFNGLQ